MNLPAYIEKTYRGVWPDRRITAPCYRDDGAKSHRDYTPLKSLKLNTPGDSRQRNQSESVSKP